MPKRTASTPLEPIPVSQNDDNGEGEVNARIESVLEGLKPIQDMAKNWDIDIATFLESYLCDLGDGMVISDTEHWSKTNFSKAALVLQNSSHVYGRKVEYLHKLVLSALEQMSKNAAHQSNMRHRNAKKGSVEDEQVQDFFEYDPNCDFLLLDDVLPVDQTADCRHINLAATAQEAELTRRFTMSASSRLSRSTNLTLGTGPTPSQTSNTTAGTFYGATSRRSSSNGQAAWLGSNLANQTTGAATSGALRLQNGVCELDDTGRLILPGSQTRSVSCDSSYVSSPSAPDRNSVVPMLDENNNDGSNANMVPLDAHEEDGGAGFFPDDDGVDDDHDDGPGFFMPGNDDAVEHPSEVVASHANHKASSKETARQVRFAPDKPDPWALLDPHEPIKSSASSKSLRLGKTFRLPKCLSKKKGDSAEEEEEEEKGATSTRSRSIVLQAFRHLMDPEEHEAPVIPMKGLVYGNEFAELARRAQSQRNAEKRRRQREERLQQLQRDAQPFAEEYQAMAEDYDDENDNDGGFLGGDDWGGDDNDYGGEEEDQGPIETNTGTSKFYRSVDADETDSRADARTFEELCRAHIAAFARGAEKYAAATNLTKRVDEWQERLDPKLKEEELRPVFDIHTYSQSVVDCLEKMSKDQPSDSCSRVVDFGQITEGRPRYDICRLFLATLSLCNSENVDFVRNNKEGEMKLNDASVGRNVQVKLLSTQIDRPTDTYLAPSVAGPFNGH